MPNIIEVTRLEESEQGTVGVLRVNKRIVGFTLEPSDMLNARNKSSIPEGQYVVRPYTSSKYPDVYEVTDVPERSCILIHPGNTAKHTAGCLLVGAKVGHLKGDRAVLNSGLTFDELRAILGRKNAHLTITSNY